VQSLPESSGCSKEGKTRPRFPFKGVADLKVTTANVDVLEICQYIFDDASLMNVTA